MNVKIPPTPEELSQWPNESLVEMLVSEACDGNEFDNRRMVRALKNEVLRRLKQKGSIE